MSAPASAKSCDEVVGVFDHQVAVEGEFGDGAEGLDHGRAEGDVGDEVAVHDVDVEDGAAAALGGCDFVGEMGEVGGEDGECQFDHLVLLPASLTARMKSEATADCADKNGFETLVCELVQSIHWGPADLIWSL